MRIEKILLLTQESSCVQKRGHIAEKFFMFCFVRLPRVNLQDIDIKTKNKNSCKIKFVRQDHEGLSPPILNMILSPFKLSADYFLIVSALISISFW